jgi:hypothetical protein
MRNKLDYLKDFWRGFFKYFDKHPWQAKLLILMAGIDVLIYIMKLTD